MNNSSVVSTIEKIKLQEQDNEFKLKEKREYESTLSSLNRTIRETLQQIDKMEQEQALLRTKVDNLNSQVVIARTRRDALVSQLHACDKELDELKAESDRGIINVWKLRSSFCNSVQEVAKECDIRSLLIKPIQSEFLPPPAKKTVENSFKLMSCEQENRLQNAMEKKEKAICERDRLMVEPELGDEFIRIKNALKYSLEMISNMKSK